MRSGTLVTLCLAAAGSAFGAIACQDTTMTRERVGVAVLEPTPDHRAEGSIRLESLEEGGVRVVATLEGLTAGRHAIHVHQFGDCSEGGAAAGPHFDFLSEGSDPDATASSDRITGNLGEVDADRSGSVRLEATIGVARLDGPRGIIGKSVVVHERGNDPASPPDGDAGARIACGVIEASDGRRIAADS